MLNRHYLFKEIHYAHQGTSKNSFLQRTGAICQSFFPIIKRNRCTDALKDYSGVANTIGASGVHISEHYLVAVCVGEEQAFGFAELFCRGYCRSCCAGAAGIAVLSGTGKQALRLKIQCQVNKLLVIDRISPFQGFGIYTHRGKSVTRAVMCQIRRADADDFFVLGPADKLAAYLTFLTLDKHESETDDSD